MFLIPIIIVVLIVLFKGITVVNQYEKVLVFTLGKFEKVLEPGLNFVWPILQSKRRVDVRTNVIEVKNQEVITKDSVPLFISTVINSEIVDPMKAVLNVQNYRQATTTMAQTLLRTNIGAHKMAELLSENDKLAIQLSQQLDEATEPWGIKVTSVKILAIDLPEGLKRAMAREAEAERERNAKVIAAEGEVLAAEKIAEAAKLISIAPAGVTLRTLQTLSEIATEQNSTIIFPFPMEMLEMFKGNTKN